MLDFHEKRKLKSRIYSKPMIGGLLVVAAFLSASVYERFSTEREMAEKREATGEELEVLQQRAATLEVEVARIKSERGIEEEIRDQFEVSKKGEQVVVIIGDDEASGTPPALPEGKPGFFDFLR